MVPPNPLLYLGIDLGVYIWVSFEKQYKIKGGVKGLESSEAGF
jgi:hypothetical protein